MRGRFRILAAALLAFACAKAQAAQPWIVELSSFDAFDARQQHIGNALGNAMLPMMLVQFARNRIAKSYGKMRAADPIRWVGYPDGKGSADVVMVYPTVDKVAKMTLNHPGAEKISADTVLLPAENGRSVPTYAVFSDDFTCCAFAATEGLARKALAEPAPAAGSELITVSSGKARGAFDFDSKGFKFIAKELDPKTAERLKPIPVLGLLAQKGVTHYVSFEDVKKIVATLMKEMMERKR